MEALAGYHCVREALRARRRRLGRLFLRSPGPRGGSEIADLAEAAGVPIEWTSEAELDERLPPGTRSQGLLLEAGPLPELGLEAAPAPAAGEAPLIVALDEVEDPQNVGAIARSAEAAGASALLLARRRAPPLSPAVSRASAGAIEHLAVIRVPNLVRALGLLGERGYWRVGADTTADSHLYWDSGDLLSGAVVLVLGGEERGLRPGVLRELDRRVRIPMRGRVESLNVSAAAAVLLFEAARCRLAGPVPRGP
jgi:23S rRNA (guanosine2251-2'-O)-methyltransferase